MKIKLVIAGDSHFNNYSLFKRKLDEYLELLVVHDNTIAILCSDRYKEMLDLYITDKEYTQIMFVDYISPSLIQKIPPIIIKSADCVILFWDGSDTDITDIKNMISLCESFDTKFRVVNYRLIHGKGIDIDQKTTT